MGLATYYCTESRVASLPTLAARLGLDYAAVPEDEFAEISEAPAGSPPRPTRTDEFRVWRLSDIHGREVEICAEPAKRLQTEQALLRITFLGDCRCPWRWVIAWMLMASGAHPGHRLWVQCRSLYVGPPGFWQEGGTGQFIRFEGSSRQESHQVPGLANNWVEARVRGVIGRIKCQAGPALEPESGSSLDYVAVRGVGTRLARRIGKQFVLRGAREMLLQPLMQRQPESAW